MTLMIGRVLMRDRNATSPPHTHFIFLNMHKGVEIQKLYKLLKHTQQVTDEDGI